jgi:hypothetical protein
MATFDLVHYKNGKWLFFIMHKLPGNPDLSKVIKNYATKLQVLS